jgi:hypothetical protein
MKNYILNLKYVIVLLSAVFFPGVSVTAQSTVFNTPSTDVVGEKRTFLEADFIAHADRYRRGGFQSYGLRGVYGIRKNVEVGINTFYTKTGETAEPVEVQPNVKWRVYQNEKYGLAVSTGAMLFAPVTKRSGGDSFALVYANVSKEVKPVNGARLTAGYYRTVAMKRDAGAKSGAMLAYEQPLVRRLSFVADWYSGNNRFGYAAAGLGLTLTRKSTLYAGYNFGNTGRGNNSLGIFYGYSF